METTAGGLHTHTHTHSDGDHSRRTSHTQSDGDHSRRTSGSGCHIGRCRYTYFIPESSVNSASLEYQESLGWQTTDLIDLNTDLNDLSRKLRRSKGLCVFWGACVYRRLRHCLWAACSPTVCQSLQPCGTSLRWSKLGHSSRKATENRPGPALQSASGHTHLYCWWRVASTTTGSQSDSKILCLKLHFKEEKT